MKTKLTLLAISTAVLLTACGGDDGNKNTTPMREDTPAVVAPIEKAPEVPKEPAFAFNWEEPTEPYYTLGLSPLDPVGLVSRYKLDKQRQADTMWFMTSEAVVGFYQGKDNITLYTHTNLYDEPETASELQSTELNLFLKAYSGLDKHCRKLTEKMSSELLADEFESLVTVMENIKGERIQTWFFKHKEEGYILVSKRNIDKPKGFISRCKDDFVQKTLARGLTGVTVNF